jgi:hypothetical protein
MYSITYQNEDEFKTIMQSVEEANGLIRLSLNETGF